MTFGVIENAERQLRSLGDSERATFFTRLIYELTLSARSISVGAKGSAETIEGLMAINQLQHLLSSQLMKILAGSTDRISASDLVTRFYRDSDMAPSVQLEAGSAFRAAIDSIGK